MPCSISGNNLFHDNLLFFYCGPPTLLQIPVFRVFKHVGAFPTPCSPSSMSSLLDERSLLFHTSCGDLSLTPQKDEEPRPSYTMSKAVPHFRYFALHNGMLLSILEQNLGNEQGKVAKVGIGLNLEVRCSPSFINLL